MASIGLGSLFTGMREQSIQLVRWLVLSGTNKLLDFMLLSVLRKDFLTQYVLKISQMIKTSRGVGFLVLTVKR